MKSKTVKQTLLEYGAGFAVWGGGFGNPSMGRSFYGRGFGFGSSNTAGAGSGAQSMYTYDVKPLNQTLEPPGTTDDGVQQIHIGSIIKGKVLRKKKYIIGQIKRIEKDSDNNIKYYLIMDPEEGKTVKVDPTSIFLWKPTGEEPKAGSADVLPMMGLRGTSGAGTSAKISKPSSTRESLVQESLKKYLNNPEQIFYNELLKESKEDIPGIFSGAVWEDNEGNIIKLQIDEEYVYGVGKNYNFKRESKKETYIQLGQWGYKYVGAE